MPLLDADDNPSRHRVELYERIRANQRTRLRGKFAYENKIAVTLQQKNSSFIARCACLLRLAPN